MTVRDYNGTGKWSADAIRARYAEYAARAGIEPQLDLAPAVVAQGDRTWIYPVMDKVIVGIEHGDTACMLIGVEFLEEDRKFPFGANLKSRAARALRRSTLSPTLALRLKRRIVAMLAAGNVPREFREYARLLRRIGFEDFWPRIEQQSYGANRHVMRYYNYLRQIHERSPAVIRREV